MYSHRLSDTVEEEFTLNQVAYLACKRRFVWFCSGIACGKTHTGARDVYKRSIMNPMTNGFIAANTYGQLHSATLPPVFKYFQDKGLDFVVDKAPPASWGITKKFKDYKNIMTVCTGSHIYLRSLDNPEYIRGIEIGWGWIDEVSSSTRAAWDIVTGRLRDPFAKDKQIRVTGTPDGDNWTWQEFKKMYDPDPNVAKFYQMIFMATIENPFLDAEDLESLMTSYDRRTAQQELFGRILTDNEANVYYEYNSENHDRLVAPYDPNKPLIFCWDFNAAKDAPMSCEIAQQHYFTNGQPYVQVLDEVIIYQGSTPKVCKELIKRFGGHKSGVFVYGDATARTRGLSVTGKSDYQQIKEYLDPVFPPCKQGFHDGVVFRVPKINMPEKDRVAAVNSMLCNSRGEVRLFTDPDHCPELIKDWREVKPDQAGYIDKKKPSRTHMSDALGYYIAKEFPVKKNYQDANAEYAMRNGILIPGGLYSH